MNSKPMRAPSKAQLLLTRSWTRMMAVAIVTLLTAASAFASPSRQIAKPGY